MTCPHQSRPNPRGRFTCALGLYGGRPYLGNCHACIAAGHNTPEHAASLDLRRAKSHPSTRPRISGCCDRADSA
jgi:hypothetical protein